MKVNSFLIRKLNGDYQDEIKENKGGKTHRPKPS
jgi:hypothetical protein